MNTRSFVPVIAIGALSATSLAGFVYSDAQNDLFDNGFANLDIASVAVTNDASNVYFAVTTRGFSDWTKYAIFIGDSNGSGSTSHPWNRPHTLNSNISQFVGSWVDSGSNNQQNWSWNGGGWWGQDSTTSNSRSGDTVTFAVSRSAFADGATMWFDVGTSGGGNDPWVDLLSRSDQSTSGWGSGSSSGAFLSYTIVPAPGALALLAVAGLVSRRRR